MSRCSIVVVACLYYRLDTWNLWPMPINAKPDSGQKPVVRHKRIWVAFTAKKSWRSALNENKNPVFLKISIFFIGFDFNSIGVDGKRMQFIPTQPIGIHRRRVMWFSTRDYWLKSRKWYRKYESFAGRCVAKIMSRTFSSFLFLFIAFFCCCWKFSKIIMIRGKKSNGAHASSNAGWKNHKAKKKQNQRIVWCGKEISLKITIKQA